MLVGQSCAFAGFTVLRITTYMMEMYGYDGLSLAIPSAQYGFVGPDLSLTDLHQVRKSSSSGKFS